MKSAVAAHLPGEHFIIRVDGRVKSHHRRFLDALRQGLQLRDQFPQHDVKVQSMTWRSRKNRPALTSVKKWQFELRHCALVCAGWVRQSS
jgi:hypothetical protein